MPRGPSTFLPGAVIADRFHIPVASQHWFETAAAANTKMQALAKNTQNSTLLARQSIGLRSSMFSCRPVASCNGLRSGIPVRVAMSGSSSRSRVSTIVASGQGLAHPGEVRLLRPSRHVLCFWMHEGSALGPGTTLLFKCPHVQSSSCMHAWMAHT